MAHGDFATGQLRSLRDVFRNRGLWRLDLAWGGYWVVEWASLVALSVWAYGEGGAAAVGVVGLLRMAPAAVALPVGAAVTDRFPRHRVLAVVYGVQALLLGVAAWATATDAPAVVVYAAVVLVGVCAAPCRPAQLALTPLLARSPDELVAANATAMSLEGVATIVGPLAAAAFLALGGTSAALAAASAVSAVSLLLVAGIGTIADPTRAATRISDSIRAKLGAGIGELTRLPELAIVISAFWAQTLVRGMLNVYVVVLALANLGLGNGGVGLLNAMFGVGVMVGAFGAASLVGRPRLSRPFVTGLALWGLPLVALAIFPNTAVALLALAATGLGNAVLDVTGFTLIQRLTDDRLLGRVFGVMYIGVIATVGIGSILAPLLVHILGLRAALGLSGALLPVLAAVIQRRIAPVDARTVVPKSLDVISAFPLFAPMPPLCREKLARSAADLTVPAGTTVIREGDEGDTFYLVVEGVLRATTDGRTRGILSPGDGFGEIALLRNVARTATVEAQTDATLLVIQRADFLSAVLGSTESAAAAETVMRHRQAPAPATS